MAASPPTDDEIERRLRALKTPALSGEVIEPARGPAGSAAPGRVPGFDPGAADAAWRAGGGPGSPGVGTRVVGWSLEQALAGRLRLWIGIVLVAFGAYLVAAQFFPGVRLVGSLAIALLGVALVVLAARGHAGGWARTSGAILAGYGALPFVAGVLGLGGGGWGSLGVGLGLLALALARALQGRGAGWQAWLGALLTIWGGWGVMGNLVPGFPTLGDMVVPVLLVALGVVLVRRGFAPAR